MGITANREELVALASILLASAGERHGSHVHLGKHNSREDGSCELVIKRAQVWWVKNPEEAGSEEGEADELGSLMADFCVSIRDAYRDALAYCVRS